MKTVLGILYFCLCIGPSQLVAVYPVCGQTSSNMSGCCMLSQGALRCTEVTCPDGYYNVVSSSTCSDSETSIEDNEVPAQKDTPVPHQGSSGTLAPSLSTTTPQSVSGSSKDDVSASQSDSDAASFKPLTSEAPRHLLENTSQKAPPSALMAEDNSSNVETSLRFLTSVTPVTSPHFFCCQCHVSCLTCSDKGPDHCLSCAPDFVLTSTNTTERCLSTPTSNFYLLIILIILPISLCSVIIVYKYRRKRKQHTKIVNIGSPVYLLRISLPSSEGLSRCQIEDVPGRVESVCLLGCEDLECQSMTKLQNRDSMKSSGQLFTIEERNNSTIPSCPFPSIADIEPEPIYWNMPNTCDCVDFGETQSVLESCDNDCLLRDSPCKKYISDSRTHFEKMNVSDSSSLSCHSTSEKSYSSIGSSPSSLLNLITELDKGISQLSTLSNSSDYERSESLQYEQRLISSAYEIPNKDKLSLPSPIISPQWQISEHFSWRGGVLKVASYSVCLEVGEGAVDITDKVTIRGAVSTDLTNAYDVLPLPEDEVIVSPIAEYFAGFYFRFKKPVRIVLPHFLSSDLPGHLVRVYEFHSENGQIKCFRLQMMKTAEDENTVTTGYFFCGSKREVHVFTHHFSGYVCTVCEEACMGYYKPPEVTLRALTKHVLRSNGKREVIVRLDLWDSRFFSPNIQQSRHQTDVSIEDRQMVLILERKLKSLDDSPDVGNAEIGARFQFSEEQTTFWTHVSSGGVNVFPIEQRLRVKELYPCRRRRPPNSMKWMLRDAQPIPRQEEFECFIHIGYIDGQIPIGASSLGNDQQAIIFMKSPDFLILPIRRAMNRSLMKTIQTVQNIINSRNMETEKADISNLLYVEFCSGEAEARPAQIRQSENTRVKNLASLSESSSSDNQTLLASNNQGCSMLRHESYTDSMRELSDTSSAKSSVSIQHVQSINNLNLYVNTSTTPTREEALGDLAWGAECGDIQERHSSLRSSVNHNITYPTPASDQ